MLSKKILLSLKEVSVLVGLSPRTITKLAASGELRSIRVGRRRLIAQSELARFVKKDHSTTCTASACPTKGGR